MRTILGPGGKVRGYVNETSTGKQLLAPGGSLLGTYDSDQDKTFLPGGRFFSSGDCLMELLED